MSQWTNPMQEVENSFSLGTLPCKMQHNTSCLKRKIENISTPLVNPHKHWEFDELFYELNLKFKKQKRTT
jgi:hypothetical protein